MQKVSGQDIKDLEARKQFLLDEHIAFIKEIAPEIPFIEK